MILTQRGLPIHAIPDFRFGTPNICTYTGLPAETMDHVFSWSSISSKDRNFYQKSSNGQGITTPCSYLANKILSSKYFNTFIQRIDYVHQEIEKKFKSVSNLPKWTPQELSELSFKLQEDIKFKLLIQKEIFNIRYWRFSDKLFAILDMLKNKFCDKSSLGYREFLDNYFLCY